MTDVVSALVPWLETVKVIVPRSSVRSTVDASSLEPREHLGRGMAVPIARAHADHRILGPQLVEPAVRRSAPRERDPTLSSVTCPNRAGNVRFRRPPASPASRRRVRP